MSGFFKRLFGASDPAERFTSPDDDTMASSRAHLAAFDRRKQPLQWAEAAQILASNLITTANSSTASGAYREASALLREAVATAGESANPLFRASMTKLHGEALYQHASLLTGDERGERLAEAANTLADTLTLVSPSQNRALWLDSAIFRGAALHELARLKSGPEGLAWFDEAAACFADVAAHGVETGTHPVGHYNRYVVLEQRGHRTTGGSRTLYYREARDALDAAMAHEMFANRPDLAVKRAELDALIEASGG